MTSRARRIIFSVCLLSLGLPSRSLCQDPSDDPAWERYQHILHASTLEWLSSQPFLLKVDFQLYDLDGKPTEKGTAEESWTRTDGKVLHIKSPSLDTSASPETEAQSYTRESYLIKQALKAIARPFPERMEKKNFITDEYEETISGSKLSCFAFAPPSAGAGAIPAYCTDVNNHLVAMTGPFFTIDRSDFRKSRDHDVPMDVKLSYEGKPALTMHVSELDVLPTETVAVDKINAVAPGTRVASAVLAGRILAKKNPKYPKEARKKHIAGSVVLAALISKEGTIKYLYVIASPSSLLAQSAKDAVQTWTYQPYLLNGQIVEVDTTIAVNYILGH